MATTTTKVDLTINELTKSIYDTITHDPNQLYFVTDDSGITSSDVTTALGYTPYSNANPSGYQANVLETVKVNGTALTATSKTVDITIPAAQTIGDGNMVIKRNGTAIGTFTANQTAASTINISVPTTASDVGALPSSTTIGNANMVIQRNSTAIGTFTANQTAASTINISVPTTAADVGALPSSTVIGDGKVIFQKNGTSFSTVSANQTATTTVNFTIPTTAADVGALPSSTTIGNGPTVFKKNGTAFATATANQTSTVNVDYTIPDAITETTVSGWGFTKNAGTVTSVNNVNPTNGNVTLSIPTVDQTFSASSTNAQSGTAVAGAGFLQNTATGSNALTVGGTASSAASAVNVGKTSTAGGGFSTAVGYYSAANGARDTAIGYSARIGGSVSDAIQIGTGTNETSKSLSVGFYNTANYQLLDGTTGLIPIERIPQILQPISTVTYDSEITIAVNPAYSIYKLVPTGDITSLTLSVSGYDSSTAVTIELYLDMTDAVRAIGFANSISWQGGEAPDLSEAGTYFFAFRTVDGGSTWIGNLQGVW